MAKIRVKQLKGNTEYTKLYGEDWVQLNQDNNGDWFCKIDIDKMQQDTESKLGKLQGVIDIDLLKENYDAFFQDAQDPAKHADKKYVIIGDVVREYKHEKKNAEDNTNINVYTYTMVSGNLPNDKYNHVELTIYNDPTKYGRQESAKAIIGENVGELELEGYKSVIVFGKMGWFNGKVQLQLTGQPIVLGGMPNIKAKIKENQDKYLDLEKSKKSEVTIGPKKELNVALITSKDIEGYYDFRNGIEGYNNSKRDKSIVIEENWLVEKMTPTAIKNQIEIINSNSITTDIICIVRGGGNKIGLLCEYSLNEELIKAVKESSIPICTGIGHVSDKTICDDLADIDGKVPYGAAIAMVNIVRGWNDKEKECAYEGIKNKNRELTEEILNGKMRK